MVARFLILFLGMLFSLGQAVAQVDARNQPTANKPQRKDPGLAKFALFKKRRPGPRPSRR